MIRRRCLSVARREEAPVGRDCVARVVRPHWREERGEQSPKDSTEPVGETCLTTLEDLGPSRVYIPFS